MKPEWFAARLKDLRKEKGLTQGALADASEVKIGTIRDLEQGRFEPTWRTVLALCKALGVDCTAFAEQPGEQPKPKRGRPPKASDGDGGTAEKPSAKRTRKKRDGS